ncbi:hypothetical protein ACFPM3_04145 [Streptomyces coeruleoprunus]|uniref:Uncharacterized protein n=1 Tax=Streptomyces coeruleoprunus TaxID=285563 RepID=A0ABV9XA59_9ACTN
MPTHLTIDAYAVQPHLDRTVLDQRNLIAQGIRTSQLGLDTDVDTLDSCTGNAATAPLSNILTPARAAAVGLALTDAAAAERYAIDLYAEATRHDRWHTAT